MCKIKLNLFLFDIKINIAVSKCLKISDQCVPVTFLVVLGYSLVLSSLVKRCKLAGL